VPPGRYCAKSPAVNRRRYGRRAAAPPPANNSVRRTYDLLRSSLPSMAPDKLLVEEELIGSLSASRNTVRIVLQLLAAQGLVKRGPKVGTTVESLVVLPISELVTLSDVRDTTTIETRVLESLVIPAPALIRERLELAVGDPVAVIEGLVLDGTGPIALTVSYVALPPGWDASLGRDGPEVVSILEGELDVELGDSDVVLAAVECDAQTAGQLGIREGSPVMWLEDLLRDAQGTPRALSQLRYRADRVTFSGRARRRQE
jgi:GntR family transcriptional regulator